MKDSLTSQNHQDFRQRYQGTFGWLLQDDKKTFVLINSVDHRAVTFVTSKGQELFANVDGGINFEFIPVNRGWFNTLKDVVYLYRHPARQFNRGISSGNTGAKVFLSTGQLNDISTTMKVLSPVFEHEVSYSKAWEEFCNKSRVNVAISKHFAICGNNNRVFFDNQECGEYHPPGSKGGNQTNMLIQLSEPSIGQEVRDALRRIGADVQVLQ